MNDPLNPPVIIYSDGSASPNPGPGGYAAILIYGEHQKEVSGGEPNTTNNRMELMAAIKSLESLNRPCQIEFHTDSQYVKNGITSWIHGWMKNGWMTAARKPVENKELWQQLYALTQKHQINWKWVKGHSTSALNNRVDELANEARRNLRRR